MNCFTIGQQYDPQIPTIHLINARPAANSAILLNRFLDRMLDHTLNPFGFYYGTIRPETHGLKILGTFHDSQCTKGHLTVN